MAKLAARTVLERENANQGDFFLNKEGVWYYLEGPDKHAPENWRTINVLDEDLRVGFKYKGYTFAGGTTWLKVPNVIQHPTHWDKCQQGDYYLDEHGIYHRLLLRSESQMWDWERATAEQVADETLSFTEPDKPKSRAWAAADHYGDF